MFANGTKTNSKIYIKNALKRFTTRKYLCILFILENKKPGVGNNFQLLCHTESGGIHIIDEVLSVCYNIKHYFQPLVTLI